VLFLVIFFVVGFCVFFVVDWWMFRFLKKIKEKEKFYAALS